jgi:glutaredoxin 3
MTKIVVYGNNYCPYCKKVATYLTNNKVPFKYIDTETEEGEEQRKIYAKQYNWKSIPLVFVNDEFVGGCDDFFKKLDAKEIVLPSL